MAAQTLSCPHCGLVLTIKRAKAGMRTSYDPAEWRRLCKYPDLDSPVLCLLEKGDNSHSDKPDQRLTR